MAGGMDLGGGGKGGKKSLDTAINLVPFIDLMAVTISFLIMTAVWNQINRLTVTQSGGVSESDGPKPPNPTVPINLMITAEGFSLSAGGPIVKIDKVNNQYVFCRLSGQDRMVDDKCDEKTLIGELKKVKANVPDQRNITLQVEDGIKYDHLIKVIDVCNLKDSANNDLFFPDVAVSSVG